MKYPNIAAELARHQITREAMAKELGVTRKTLFNWERNGRIPACALERMSDIFGCSIDYLLENERRKP